SLTLLLGGDFKQGAAEYEWRWRSGAVSRLPDLGVRAWDGHPLAGQTLLLRAEQGLGDAIQFVRYAPLVRARCGRLIVQCREQLARLFATVPGVDQVFSEDQKLPPVAAQAPMLSLMHLLGTTLETLPANVPYLGVDPARIARFEQRIGAAKGLKVGLVWAGSP